MHARVVLVSGDAVVATWTLASRGRPDLALIDHLARAQLEAQRLGYALLLEDASDELVRLLDLVGLRVEVLGQPERGEQRGVEEAVVPDDPIA